MSDQDDPTSFRRITRRDRKRKLEARGSLFPPEDEQPSVSDEQFAPPELREVSADDPPSTEAEVVEAAPAETPVEVVPPPKPAADRFPALPVDEPQIAVSARTSPAVPRQRGTCLPNLIAVLFCIGSIAAAGIFAVIYANPYTPLNPFPPFTPIPVLITATFLPPTATPPPTETPPEPTATFTPLAAEAINTESPFPFVLLNEGAVYIPNANDQGCNWSSIAGTVTDLNGAPLDGYGIRVRGEGRDETVFTGSAATFGPGGFELFLNGVPTEAEFTVQLLSPQGAPLSQEYPVATRATCEENVAVLSFAQIRAL